MALYLGLDKITSIPTGLRDPLDTTLATAYPEHIQKDYVAYARGQRIVGTMQPNSEDIKVGAIIAGVNGSFTSDATAIDSEHIVDGYTAYANGNKIVGTFRGLDTSDATASLGEHIVDGYTAYANGVKILGTFKGLDTSDATALSSEILLGKTAYVNGTLVTGTINSKAATTYIPTTTDQTITAGLYLAGVQTIKGDANLLAANIKTGVSIFGVSGTFTADATATAAQILTGQSAYVKGVKISGAMANQGAKTASLNCGESYTIPAGFHDGAGKITANSLASQTSATATAAQILSGKTAWVNGTKLTGTMASKAAATYTPGTSNQTIAAGQYLSGTQTIAGDADLEAANIKTGVNIFNVAGTFTSDATATAFYIQRGYTAYAKGSKLTGTGPKIYYQASAPTSGMSAGDIWVQTSSLATGDNQTFTIASASVSKAFTEYQDYTGYARTLTGTVSATLTFKHTGSTLTTTYKIPATVADPGTTEDWDVTFYYTLQYIASNGTTSTLVSSSVAIAHGGSSTPSGTVNLSTQYSGYYKLTYYFTTTYRSGVTATSTVTTSTVTKTTDAVRSLAPAVPSGSGGSGYMRSAAIWSGREWNEYRQFS